VKYKGICSVCLKRVKCKFEWKEEIQNSPIQYTMCEGYKEDIKAFKVLYPELFKKVKRENKRKVE